MLLFLTNPIVNLNSYFRLVMKQVKLNWIIWLGIFLGIIISLVPIEYSMPVFILLSGVLIGIFIIVTIEPKKNRFLMNIFFTGILVRILMCLLLCLTSLYFFNTIFFNQGDDVCYSFNAWNIVKYWKTTGVYPQGESLYNIYKMSSNNITAYDHWGAYVYYITGNSPLSLMFINCLAGAFNIIFIYSIAKQIFGKKVAEISACFATFWPSLILWSTQNLKESITTFLVCTCVWAIINIKNKFRFLYLFTGLISFYLLFQFRIFCAILISIAFSISLIFSLKIKEWIFLLILLIMLLFVFQNNTFSFKQNLLFFTQQVIVVQEKSIFKRINKMRKARTDAANTAFFTNIDISNPMSALIFLPIGLMYALLAPFPWQVSNLGQIIGAFEMFIWYIFLPFTMTGLFFSFHCKFRHKTLFILFFIFIVLISFALLEGNIGTMFRHRSIIMALFFIFTSAGIVKKRGLKQKLLDS